jgi:hypothetical protein
MNAGKRGMRAAALLMLVLSLGGCAAHTWAPGPGMSAADFEPAKARCSLLARHSGGDFAAFGSESYVAGAALGHAIGESAQAQRDFNDCMLAAGWRIADQPAAAAAAAPQDPRIARLKEIRAELTTCINAIRAKPTYASLQPHLIDLNTGRYTMVQLADERIPTPEESRLLTAYVDERASCTDNFVAAGSQILPSAAPILAQERSDSQALLLLLVKRQTYLGRSGATVAAVAGSRRGKAAHYPLMNGAREFLRHESHGDPPRLA